MACGYRVVQASPPAVKPSECPVAYSIFLSPASLARDVVSGLTNQVPKAAEGLTCALESNRTKPISVCSPGKWGDIYICHKVKLDFCRGLQSGT